MIAWIRTIPPEDADSTLASAYDEAMTPHGTVDNVMQAHSLRPHTMLGHIALYRAALHHPDNELPEWFLEAVGTYTSILNGCEYSLAHHAHNARTLLGGGAKGDAAIAALRAAAEKPPIAIHESTRSIQSPGHETPDELLCPRPQTT